MGPGIVVLFWLFIAGVFAVGWAVALGLFILSWWRNWRVWKWIAGLTVGGLTAFAMLLAGLFVYGYVRSATPRFVFADTFGVAPGPGISNINSKVFWFADEGSTYLRFEADAATFHSLVPSGLPHVSDLEYANKRWQGNEAGPAWWTYTFPPDAEIHLLTTEPGQGKRFASEMTLMVYVPREHLVYYHYEGID